jgi:hypothetical protein
MARTSVWLYSKLLAQNEGMVELRMYSLEEFAKTEAVHSSITLTHKQGIVTHNTIWDTEKVFIVSFFVY